MAFGRKTGGRAAGTPNRKTQEVAELLESLGCNPIEGMARIAMHPKTKLELRARMFAELAGYVYPKRKAVEHSTAEGALPIEDIRIHLIAAENGRPKYPDQLVLAKEERAGGENHA
jgi:hypothetical protein